MIRLNSVHRCEYWMMNICYYYKIFNRKCVGYLLRTQIPSRNMSDNKQDSIVTNQTNLKKLKKTTQDKPVQQLKSSNEEEKQASSAKEINGPKGLEPTRYGDWESKGRCYDF